MKYKIKNTSQFKKDYKQVKKQGLDINALEDVVDLIAEGNPLP